MGDETAIPYATNPRLWDKRGFTAAGYAAAYQEMYQTYLQAFPKTPLAAPITGFGQRSKSALQGQPEEQALRELLEFVGTRGIHYVVPDGFPLQQSGESYLKDEILLPTFRKHAMRSKLLLLVSPRDRKADQSGREALQVAQAAWPEVPVGLVILTPPNGDQKPNRGALHRTVTSRQRLEPRTQLTHQAGEREEAPVIHWPLQAPR